jgi:catechol 2,3-dioxygenase-like lactoylglutathione lyase family enzyme
MAAVLDHLILPVGDMVKSLHFYTEVLGFEHAGQREVFEVLRVNEDCSLQLAAWGTAGGTHLAFAMASDEFDSAFARIRAAGLAYGDAFDRFENMKGPGEAEGAHGKTESVYCLDPSKHLIEIIKYG